MTSNDIKARKNALILSCCQALNGLCAMTVITTAGLLGFSFADNKAYATLPVAFFNLGSWLTAYPAAQFMQRYGRQNGFFLGALIGLVGALITFYAILERDFILLSLGTTFLGSFQGFAQLYRFAATDLASDAYKPKAISTVLIGGIAAAIIGGPLITASKLAYGGVIFAGCFLVVAIAAILVCVLLIFLHNPQTSSEAVQKVKRSRREIFSEPKLLVGILCGMVTYSLMSLVMTASPLAMQACNHGVDDTTTVIQWHVLGMFAPSLFTGTLIAKIGVRPVMLIGFILLILSAVIALIGISFWHFWASLLLLGIGWNFGFIGSSSLVASSARPEEKGIVQGTNDTLVLGLVALASFMSGQFLDSFGWEFINYLVFPMGLIAILSLMWLGKREQKESMQL